MLQTLVRLDLVCAWAVPYPYPERAPRPANPLRSSCPPPRSGSVSVLPTSLRFSCSHLLISFRSLSNSFRLPLAAPGLFVSLGLPGSPSGNRRTCSARVAGFAASPRRPEAAPRAIQECLGPPLCLGSCGPALGPPLSFFLGSFVLSQSLFHVAAVFFLSFSLTLPLMTFSLTAAKVSGWEGRPGFWEGLVRVANPRSNTFRFLVLEPPALPVSGQQAWLLWKQ